MGKDASKYDCDQSLEPLGKPLLGRSTDALKLLNSPKNIIVVLVKKVLSRGSASKLYSTLICKNSQIESETDRK